MPVDKVKSDKEYMGPLLSDKSIFALNQGDSFGQLAHY